MYVPFNSDILIHQANGSIVYGERRFLLTVAKFITRLRRKSTKTKQMALHNGELRSIVTGEDCTMYKYI